MTPVLKMTKEAIAICENNIEIVSFFTFPLYMKFMGRCYFGHSAIMKLEKTIAYLGYQMKYHKKGDGLVGLSTELDNTRACIVPELVEFIVEEEATNEQGQKGVIQRTATAPSVEFKNALGNLFAMSFFASGLIQKIKGYCDIAAEGSGNSINVAAAQEMQTPVSNTAANLPNLSSESAEAIGDKVINTLSQFFVVAPWNRNWKNILGNVGNHTPRWNLPLSKYLKADKKEVPVYNILPDANSYKQFNPVLGMKVNISKA